MEEDDGCFLSILGLCTVALGAPAVTTASSVMPATAKRLPTLCAPFASGTEIVSAARLSTGVT
jgi:hypothetical protein